MAKTPIGKSDDVVDSAPETDVSVTSKGHATPTRREREALNLRPLVQSDRKLANKTSRAKMAEVRDRTRVGMANGEEKYLTVRDRGPQRRYVRDYVDARFSVGEVLIPVMFLVILTTFIPSAEGYSIIVLWVFFGIAVIDCVILGTTLKRKLGAKFGAENVQGGTRWYASMRALQLRPMRLPKPQVKRGKYPN